MTPGIFCRSLHKGRSFEDFFFVFLALTFVLGKYSSNKNMCYAQFRCPCEKILNMEDGVPLKNRELIKWRKSCLFHNIFEVFLTVSRQKIGRSSIFQLTKNSPSISAWCLIAIQYFDTGTILRNTPCHGSSTMGSCRIPSQTREESLCLNVVREWRIWEWVREEWFFYWQLPSPLTHSVSTLRASAKGSFAAQCPRPKGRSPTSRIGAGPQQQPAAASWSLPHQWNITPAPELEAGIQWLASEVLSVGKTKPLHFSES